MKPLARSQPRARGKKAVPSLILPSPPATDEPGWSLREIAASMGISVGTAHQRLTRAVEAGEWGFVGKAKRPGIMGQVTTVPLYAPVRARTPISERKARTG